MSEVGCYSHYHGKTGEADMTTQCRQRLSQRHQLKVAGSTSFFGFPACLSRPRRSKNGLLQKPSHARSRASAENSKTSAMLALSYAKLDRVIHWVLAVKAHLPPYYCDYDVSLLYTTGRVLEYRLTHVFVDLVYLI